MPGPRYYNWAHRRVIGDPSAAAPYWGTARKLLGAVVQEAARNGLGVHMQTLTLRDGAILIAEKHGDILRMTVKPPPTGGAKWAKFKTRAFLLTHNIMFAVDLEEYEVRDEQIIRTKKVNELVGQQMFAEDAIMVDASIDGSYYRPRDKHGKDIFAVDFGNNSLIRMTVDPLAVDGLQTYPDVGNTELLASVMANPTSRHIYSYSVFSGTLNRIDADTFDISGSNSGALSPGGLRADNACITPDGRYIYSLEQPAPDNSYITVIRADTMESFAVIDIVGQFGVGTSISAVVASPDNRYVYGIGWISPEFDPIPGYSDIASLLVKIDTTSNIVVAYQVFAHRGFYLAMGKVSRNGNKLYVYAPLLPNSSNSGSVYIVDTEALVMLKGLPPGDIYSPAYFPDGMALSPDGKRYYVAGHTAPDVLPRTNSCIAVCDYDTDTVDEIIEISSLSNTSGLCMVTIPIFEETPRWL